MRPIKKPNEKHFQSKFQKWKLLQAEKLFIERDNGITDLNKKGKAIDSLFHYLNDTTPGIALAVIQDQKPIIEKFYGRAKLNSGESISGSTVFRMASIAKQFVAMAILLLEERHKLKLNDDIRKYLPELPQYKDTIRITHLLNNTSGLDDPITEEVWSGGGYESTDKTEWSHLTNEYALSKLINKGPELAVSPPGSLYNYNNAGYSLLVLIIEKVSGQSIQNYGKTNIFMPLGMNNTYFDTLPSHKSKYKAQGYIKQENSFIPYEWKLTATGALMSTLNDLYLWEANFHKNKLGEKDPLLTRKMLENTVVVDGEVRYGLGLFLFQYAEEMVFGHDGDALSYTTNLWMFPELGLSIILLSNISREFHDSEKLTGKVASILLDVD